MGFVLFFHFSFLLSFFTFSFTKYDVPVLSFGITLGTSLFWMRYILLINFSNFLLCYIVFQIGFDPPMLAATIACLAHPGPLILYMWEVSFLLSVVTTPRFRSKDGLRCCSVSGGYLVLLGLGPLLRDVHILLIYSTGSFPDLTLLGLPRIGSFWAARLYGLTCLDFHLMGWFCHSALFRRHRLSGRSPHARRAGGGISLTLMLGRVVAPPPSC